MEKKHYHTVRISKDHNLKVQFTGELFDRLKEYQKSKPYFVSMPTLIAHAVWLYLELNDSKRIEPQEAL
jgi:hypothetical protein